MPSISLLTQPSTHQPNLVEADLRAHNSHQAVKLVDYFAPREASHTQLNISTTYDTLKSQYVVVTDHVYSARTLTVRPSLVSLTAREEWRPHVWVYPPCSPDNRACLTGEPAFSPTLSLM
jgi:hypothetical protein